MPNNRRPDGWIVSNPDWEGTTRAQRRQAQDTWDLLAEQEKANELSKQKIEEDRENAKRIAEATKQAEKDRYENELDLEIRRQVSERQIEESRQDHEELMRQKKMCEVLGMDYDEILIFKDRIDNWNIDILKQCNKLGEEKEKIIVEVTELSKQKLSYNTSKEINELKEELEDLEQDYKDEQEYLNRSLENDKRRNEERKRNQPKPKVSLLDRILGKEPKENNFEENIEGYNTRSHRKRCEELEEEIKLIKDKIKELEKIYEEQESQDTDLENKIDVIWKRFLEIEEKLGELHKENDKYKSTRYGHKEFNEFRKTHYNTDVERLFRRLDFDYIDLNKVSSKVSESRFDTIPQEEVISNGTIEDYLNFMDNVLNA